MTTIAPEAVEYLRWLFSYQALSIRQKLIAIAEKYTVDDIAGFPRFHVVRPPKLILNIVAGLAGLAVNLVFLVAAWRFLILRQEIALGIALLVAGGWLGLLVRILIAPFRDIVVYTDESMQFPVLTISQDNKFAIWRRYTVFDALGQPVGCAVRNTITAIWRRGWTAESVDGQVLFRIREDKLVLALLRRYLGPMWGLLRTNFDFVLPDGRVVGEYNRQLTLTDQYVLDLRADTYWEVDRRMALALAILLDTGERR